MYTRKKKKERKKLMAVVAKTGLVYVATDLFLLAQACLSACLMVVGRPTKFSCVSWLSRCFSVSGQETFLA